MSQNIKPLVVFQNEILAACDFLMRLKECSLDERMDWLDNENFSYNLYPFLSQRLTFNFIIRSLSLKYYSFQGGFSKINYGKITKIAIIVDYVNMV
jgi:hypothetical protein